MLTLSDDASEVAAVKAYAEAQGDEECVRFFHCPSSYELTDRMRSLMGLPQHCLGHLNPQEDLFYICPDEITTTNVAKFLESISNGTAEPYIKSQERTPDDK